MQKLNLALAAILVVSLVSHTMEAKAQLNQYLISKIESFHLFVDSLKILASSPGKKFTLPNRGRPSRLSSTGRRGRCSDLKEPFIALIPHFLEQTQDENVVSALGKTAQSEPVFWFYVPKLPQDVRKLEFRLLNENKEAQKYILNLTDTPGIVGFRPSLHQKLKLNQQYHFTASIIYCDSDISKNPTVDSWVERVTLGDSLENQLRGATAEKRIELYSKNGIWHETLTLLVEKHQENPNNPMINDQLVSLLKDAGFENIANKTNIKYYILSTQNN
ncbi:DUF928 domain-containing protein [Aulosira sp. FACHB-615]|uniref:DUF928 domain-containing protein n=1 Tax=Aulosira sp. FACHB-615 TaxID=2692777 RepID=UPI0016863EE9|nr:DUF928 domain-containing protein [Aulosira sp. FACHB-615]MBD2492322.1 DUF928 domain-containing protein [Aulosira sp. FACHB-615]